MYETVALWLISDFCSAINLRHGFSTSYGFTGLLLEWLQLFLDQLTILVTMGSDWVLVLLDVHRSSVLGSLLYILYVAYLTSVITAFGSHVHRYPKNVQMYFSCQTSDSLACLMSVLNPMMEVQSWMSYSGLQIKPAKCNIYGSELEKSLKGA